MLPARWEEIDRIYQATIEHPPHERAAFLAQACGGDESLRSEIVSLLAHERSSFLETRQQAAVAEFLAPDRQPEAEADAVAGNREPARAASLPWWAKVFIVVAVLRTAAGLVLYLATAHPDWPAAEVPYPVYAVLSVTFTVVGLALVLANRRDQRAAWLGGVYILVVAPLATPLIQDVRWALFIRPESLTAAFFWRFVSVFPTVLESRAGRIVRGVAAAAAAAGALLFAAHLLGLLSASLLPVAMRAREAHWLVSMAIASPGLLVLLWRAAASTGAARRSVVLFARGLLVGFAPFTIEVLLEGLWPAYARVIHRPETEPIVGTIIFGALAIVPAVTAYSVLYDQVVDMRVVMRGAIQYGLARYTIIAATLVPFAALALYLFRNRAESIATQMAGPRPLFLSAFGLAGLVTLRLRTKWLDRVDRRYFREAYDAREILSRVVGDSPPATDAELARRLHDEIGRALHAEVAIFLVDERRTALQDVGARLESLSVNATLTDLTLGDARPMDVNLDDPSSPLSRLPMNEQQWLRRGRFSLLVGLRRAGGGAAGLLALAPKRSGLPYSPEDRRLLATMASTASLSLDSLRLASTPDAATSPAARECTGCSRLSPPGTEQCRCGRPLADAAVPHVLRGVFRIEERIGAGGMGVVYRAVDQHLRRDVAIKALPHVTPAGVARLRREAQAMAAVNHPNLAVIHGIETWHDRPFLVQEYLAGGTLAHRLRTAPPTLGDALTLVITLADLLQHLHGSGVIHCDIKPSNIGFTQHNLVKLLDFGLARVLRDMRTTTTQAISSAVSDRPGAIFGTPHFMSPEAIRGEPPTPLVDLWALSVVLFQTVTGRLPFEGRDKGAIFLCVLAGSPLDPREARPDLPAAFDAFFQQAFARDPRQRPADAAAMASLLRGLLATNP